MDHQPAGLAGGHPSPQGTQNVLEAKKKKHVSTFQTEQNLRGTRGEGIPERGENAGLNTNHAYYIWCHAMPVEVIRVQPRHPPVATPNSYG